MCDQPDDTTPPPPAAVVCAMLSTHSCVKVTQQFLSCLLPLYRMHADLAPSFHAADRATTCEHANVHARTGTTLPACRDRISTGCLTVDDVLGGGIPRGRVIEVFGPESSGKTTLALSIMAQA